MTDVQVVVVEEAPEVVIVVREPETSVLSFAEQGPPGPPGPRGPAGSGSGYAHVQASPAAVWTVRHNLGFRPGGVLAYDTDGEPIQGKVRHLNENVTLIEFFTSVAGCADVS